MAAGTAQFHLMTVDQHTVFYNLDFTKTDIATKPRGFLPILKNNYFQFIQIWMFRIPFKRIFNR